VKLPGDHEARRLDLAISRRFSPAAVKRARIHALVLLPLLAGVLLLYGYRRRLLGPEWDVAVRIATAVVILILGFQFARDIGRAVVPMLQRRLDPATAGTIEFLVRLGTMLIVVGVALRVAGLGIQALALGGAATAVVVGLAAQQTLGNLIAGTVLATARPFRVGERLRLQGGGLAGTVEGVVSSLGLLYTTLSRGADAILVPNSVVLSVALMPLREPAGIDVRARLRHGVTPAQVEEVLRAAIRTPIRGPPRVLLEELAADEVVVRIVAVPLRETDGPDLASEVLEAIAPYTASAHFWPPRLRDGSAAREDHREQTEREQTERESPSRSPSPSQEQVITDDHGG
jgi:small-conductance mechanosensitive channel